MLHIIEHNIKFNFCYFVASCPYFKQMQNGVVSGTKRTHGSTIQFTCNDGYQQIGASSATCEDGKWSEILPRCLG